MILEVGDRVIVVDRGDPHCGQWGTVTVREHPATLTQRPMVEVRLDGRQPAQDEGYYVEQVELVRLEAVA